MVDGCLLVFVCKFSDWLAVVCIYKWPVFTFSTCGGNYSTIRKMSRFLLWNCETKNYWFHNIISLGFLHMHMQQQCGCGYLSKYLALAFFKLKENEKKNLTNLIRFLYFHILFFLSFISFIYFCMFFHRSSFTRVLEVMWLVLLAGTLGERDREIFESLVTTLLL